MTWNGVFFPRWAENIWVRFLNWKSIASIPYSLPPFKFKSARYARIDSMREILESCDIGDLRFLDKSLDWQRIIRENSENSSENISCKLASIFVRAIVSNSEDIDRRRFEQVLKILSVLDCRWSAIYGNDFRSIASSLGFTLHY